MFGKCNNPSKIVGGNFLVIVGDCFKNKYVFVFYFIFLIVCFALFVHRFCLSSHLFFFCFLRILRLLSLLKLRKLRSLLILHLLNLLIGGLRICRWSHLLQHLLYEDGLLPQKICLLLLHADLHCVLSLHESLQAVESRCSRPVHVVGTVVFCFFFHLVDIFLRLRCRSPCTQSESHIIPTSIVQNCRNILASF